MLRNYLVTALRNLERDRLYAGISILGMAVAFTTAILIAQFVRNEFSYDRWVPGYQRVYKVTDVLIQPGQAPSTSDEATAGLADRLKAQFPQAIAVGRLGGATTPLRRSASDPVILEPSLAWADPDIFKVLPLPVLSGDLQSALRAPDSVVITQRMARKYFGRDLPIGDTLQIKDALAPYRGSPITLEKSAWYTFRVTAVINDLPPNTNLPYEIIASGNSPISLMAFMKTTPPGGLIDLTFVRLSPGTKPEDLDRALNIAGQPDIKVYASVGARFSFHAVRLPDLHLMPVDATADVVKPTGSRGNAYAIAAVGALVVLVAAINFVTLLTARAARRAVEVGVRKVTGAGRGHLMIQFIGEALVQVALSTIIAAAFAELLVIPFGALTQRGLTLDYLHDPLLVIGIAAAALGIGLLASVYPALVLSSFRPGDVLKGGPIQLAGSVLPRNVLVVVQFAVLLGLIVAATTVYRQTEFALARGFGGGAESDRILRVSGGCDNAFVLEVRRLRGVTAAACSSLNALNTPKARNGTLLEVRGHPEVFDIAPVDFGFLELYGLKPLAGRVFSREHGEDGVLADLKQTTWPTVMLNEAAARRMGYADPRTAVGQTLTWIVNSDPVHPIRKRSQIIGIVPDMPLSVRSTTDPFVYYVSPRELGILSIKLAGQDMPRTVRAIDGLWRRTGHSLPLQAVFMSQFRIGLYLDLITQGVTVGGCAALAVLIACFGLLGLSAFVTERRTKEIGIRKTMGAGTFQVILLLVWQFTIPVVTATAIAIPVVFVAMRWWLQGFAYHVDLSAWTFVLAAVAAVVIAWVTVSYQSFLVARAKPVNALRYE